MKILVAILTDIHLTVSPSHVFAKRISLIASAIGSAEVAPEAIILVFGGDIANWGLAEEYGAMTALISTLKQQLATRFPRVPIYVIAVPGNHDLHHPKDSEAYRKSLVESSLATLQEQSPNEVFLSQLLAPQAPYFEFSKSLDFWKDGLHTRLCSSIDVPLGKHRIRLNLLNTALLSQKKEQQGSLYLPISLLRQSLEGQDDSVLSITVMHHPVQWIESNNLLELRDILGRTSDYVLTGHQHFSSGYELKDDLGPNLKYYESPALYDPERPTSSAFRALVFDLDNSTEKQFLFRWKGSRYEPDQSLETSSNWSALVSNRVLRPTIAMNPAAVQMLNNPGFAYVRKDRLNVGLLDIFVYPDLRESQGIGTNVKVVKGKDVLAHVSKPGITILQGSPLSGKTSISKKLVLDVRAQNDAVPVWLDGASIALSTVEELQNIILDAFRQQYSKQQVTPYTQLLPQQRAVIIDNWHIARVQNTSKAALYLWLNKFAGFTLLLVDQVYQVKELLSYKRPDDVTDPDLDEVTRRVYIGSLSNVSKASLIHRWIRSRQKISVDEPEVSKESRKIEELVSALLGKDSLPPYAFFVLCVLQALESNKTAAIAGGSFGPLFEILIQSALEKTQSDDLQISLKLVFMQEIAYYMWTNRKTQVSREEIEQIAQSYKDRQYFDLPTTLFLEDLQVAKIFTYFDGNYSFAYPHYCYYSVARYIRDHLDDDVANDLRDKINLMIDQISSVENSAIVMFLIYFEKEKYRIIDRLVQNASMIYSSVDPARLEGDAEVFSLHPSLIEVQPIENNPDIAKNREAIRVKRDELEAKKQDTDPGPAPFEMQKGYAYSEDLEEGQKLHLVQQNISTLGQVIRNHSANLEGPRKLAVLRASYLLSLRSLGRVMQAFGDLIRAVQGLKDVGDNPLSVAVIRVKVSQIFSSLTQYYAVYVIQNLSSNIGVSAMEKAYTTVLSEMDETVAVKMIAVTIQMYHFAAFPEQEIRQLHSEVKGSKFTLGILQMLVASYLIINQVDKRTLDAMVKLFNLNEAVLMAAKP